MGMAGEANRVVADLGTGPQLWHTRAQWILPGGVHCGIDYVLTGDAATAGEVEATLGGRWQRLPLGPFSLSIRCTLCGHTAAGELGEVDPA